MSYEIIIFIRFTRMFSNHVWKIVIWNLVIVNLLTLSLYLINFGSQWQEFVLFRQLFVVYYINKFSFFDYLDGYGPFK